MKKVYQTIDTKEYGNCLEACLASIFENEITDYPTLNRGKKWPLWIEPINEYLIKAFGCYLLCLETDTPEDDFRGYYIVVGNNKGATHTHAMVGLKGKVVFDPSGMKNTFETYQYLVILKLFK